MWIIQLILAFSNEKKNCQLLHLISNSKSGENSLKSKLKFHILMKDTLGARFTVEWFQCSIQFYHCEKTKVFCYFLYLKQKIKSMIVSWLLPEKSTWQSVMIFVLAFFYWRGWCRRPRMFSGQSGFILLPKQTNK